MTPLKHNFQLQFKVTMATADSPSRTSSDPKKMAPAGTWASPDKAMVDASAEPQPDLILLLPYGPTKLYDVEDIVTALKPSKNAGRRKQKGLRWYYKFRLSPEGRVDD